MPVKLSLDFPTPEKETLYLDSDEEFTNQLEESNNLRSLIHLWKKFVRRERHILDNLTTI
ncbi:hypothetical protein [Trichormus variabilis]|uniref:Uncharacterized protein n=1 Tax=Trichormus variabilis SAG 1403-4b TaxID=447716 RepID=A0A3S1C241_ANAVA|nr:hypothetical protein [Trichormus variabilis]MBD2626846.1 hypothetical protein [Trichormus variabilis FACHB-164]RUS95347.1 hypothetical protein DSM107003_30500 [Trichormus variabilis SAG 1403-4b]